MKMNYEINLDVKKRGLRHVGTLTIKEPNGDVRKKTEMESIYLHTLLAELQREVMQYEKDADEKSV